MTLHPDEQARELAEGLLGFGSCPHVNDPGCIKASCERCITETVSVLLAHVRQQALEEAAQKLTSLADELRDEVPEAMGVAWDVVTGWIAAIRSLRQEAGEETK